MTLFYTVIDTSITVTSSLPAVGRWFYAVQRNKVVSRSRFIKVLDTSNHRFDTRTDNTIQFNT